MSKLTLNRFRWTSLPLAMALIVGASQLVGQERESAKPAAKAEKKEKSTGRLPPYYGQVVTKEQREKIYAVQAKYADQIEKLLEQVDTLEKSQTEEIEAVLSQEQRDQVMKLASEAKSKRSKKAEKAPDADAGK
jgi:hypothetical protein